MYHLDSENINLTYFKSLRWVKIAITHWFGAKNIDKIKGNRIVLNLNSLQHT